ENQECEDEEGFSHIFVLIINKEPEGSSKIYYFTLLSRVAISFLIRLISASVRGSSIVLSVSLSKTGFLPCSNCSFRRTSADLRLLTADFCLLNLTPLLSITSQFNSFYNNCLNMSHNLVSP